VSSSTVTTPADTPRESIAPWWHTALVLVPLATGSIASAYQHGLENLHVPGLSSRFSSYLTVFLEEWFVVLLIWLALRRRGLSIGSLVSGRWQTLGAFFKDLGLGIGFLVVEVPLTSLLSYLLGDSVSNSTASFTPQTGFELVVWVGLAATAGFCEELIFRGYLTRQFRAWTGSRVFAIVLQSAAFGLIHGYYNYKTIVAIMVEGCLLGLLAHWRKSLRPGMVAHGLEDVLGGLVGFLSR
jgi:membrane protease YdiL (CAAX protease family)